MDCIHNYCVKERNFDNTVVSLRLTNAEAVRFWHIMDAVKARNPWLGKSDVYREMLGLAPPKAITQDELLFFRTGKKRSAKTTDTSFDFEAVVKPKATVKDEQGRGVGEAVRRQRCKAS